MSLIADRMFVGDWVRDPRLRKLGRHVQLLLIFLRPFCDRYRKFECDPKEVHRLIYASVEDNVSVKDVEAWLEILRSGGFISAYIGVDGRRVGEICKPYWRQRLKYGKAFFDPDPGESDEGGLPLGAPSPRPPRKEEKGSEVSDGRAAPRDTHDEFTDDRMPEVCARWPDHNVPRAREAARRYVRKKNGDGARLTVEFFERDWMPNEAKERVEALAPVEELYPGITPDKFFEWVIGRYGKPPQKNWGVMVPSDRAYFYRLMKEDGAA